jgi:phage terminase small subunit
VTPSDKTPGKLSAREEAFCVEYIKDNNGKQAALRAGYAPKAATCTASRLLTRSHIRLRMFELRAHIQTAAVLSAQETMEEVTRIATADIYQFFEISPGNAKILICRDWNLLPPGMTRLIRKIRQRVVKVGRREELVTEIELWDKDAALRLLAEYWNILRTGQQASAPDVKKEFADLADAIRASHGSQIQAQATPTAPQGSAA